MEDKGVCVDDKVIIKNSEINNISEIIIIEESVNKIPESGVYLVSINNKREVFVKNGFSVNVIVFYYGFSNIENINIPITDDLKEEFFDKLSKIESRKIHNL
jgi:hypothetical protein